jgi:excisionase family DNA binding protein
MEIIRHDPLLNVRETAEYLGYAEQTIRNMAHRGVLPKTKLGRTLRFRLSDLNRWIDERSTRPAA